VSRILLADDDDDVVVLVRFKLEQEGHEVVAVGDGQDALDAAAEGPFDLAIVDVMMPLVDGFEVTRRLVASDPAPRVLLLTAKGREADVETGFDAGADDYLVKPFSPRELVRRVERLLRA
jgi:two-component system, OmpR family, response regulator MtrA